MKLHISSRGHGIPEKLRSFVTEKVEKATQRFVNRINRVDVSVINRTDGIDQRCRIVLSVDGRREIIASATSDNILAAISEAVDRARRGLSRAIERQRDTHRRMTQLPPL